MWNNVQAGIIRKNIWCCANERRIERNGVFNTFTDSVEKTVIPPAEDIRIVHYDEQHPKKGRTQRFRVTLLDGVTG